MQNKANFPPHGQRRPSPRPEALTLPPGTRDKRAKQSQFGEEFQVGGVRFQVRRGEYPTIPLFHHSSIPIPCQRWRQMVLRDMIETRIGVIMAFEGSRLHCSRRWCHVYTRT